MSQSLTFYAVFLRVYIKEKRRTALFIVVVPASSAPNNQWNKINLLSRLGSWAFSSLLHPWLDGILQQNMFIPSEHDFLAFSFCWLLRWTFLCCSLRVIKKMQRHKFSAILVNDFEKPLRSSLSFASIYLGLLKHCRFLLIYHETSSQDHRSSRTAKIICRPETISMLIFKCFHFVPGIAFRWIRNCFFFCSKLSRVSIVRAMVDCFWIFFLMEKY